MKYRLHGVNFTGCWQAKPGKCACAVCDNRASTDAAAYETAARRTLATAAPIEPAIFNIFYIILFILYIIYSNYLFCLLYSAYEEATFLKSCEDLSTSRL